MPQQHMNGALEQDDQRLIAAVQRGDADALDALVQRHHAPLVQFLERVTGDPETAADLAQETLLKMIRALPRYEPRAKFSTWLFTIAMNSVRDDARVRRLQRQRLRPLEDAEHQPPADPPRPLDEAALDRVVHEDIRRALAALSPEHRAVVALHYYEDLSYKDIAAVCGCTVGTVGSRLHYAVKRLRRQLEPDEE